MRPGYKVIRLLYSFARDGAVLHYFARPDTAAFVYLPEYGRSGPVFGRSDLVLAYEPHSYFGSKKAGQVFCEMVLIVPFQALAHYLSRDIGNRFGYWPWHGQWLLIPFVRLF